MIDNDNHHQNDVGICLIYTFIRVFHPILRLHPNILYDEITGVLWYSAANPTIFAIQNIFSGVMNMVFFTNWII